MFKMLMLTAENRILCLYQRSWSELEIFRFSSISVSNPNYHIYHGRGLPLHLGCKCHPGTENVSWYVLLLLLCSYGHSCPLSHFHQLSFSPACEPFSTGMLKQRSLSTYAVRDAGKKHLNAWKTSSLLLMLFNIVVQSCKLLCIHHSFFALMYALLCELRFFFLLYKIVLISYKANKRFTHWDGRGGRQEVVFHLKVSVLFFHLCQVWKNLGTAANQSCLQAQSNWELRYLVKVKCQIVLSSYVY